MSRPIDDEAIQVDTYLDELLASRSRHATVRRQPSGELTHAAGVVREALVRFHPSFRFEEDLAGRLRAVALGAAGAATLIRFPGPVPGTATATAAADPAGEMLYNKQLEKTQKVCGKCGHHFRLRIAERLETLVDAGSFQERDAGLESVDPLGFVDSKAYPDRLAQARAATGAADAAVWGMATVGGTPVALCVMDFAFMGGSMGSVVGEKVTLAAEAALADRVPLIVVSASGGARMQEGTLALMQLAKTCAALARLADAGVPFISLLTDPTTGGVFASFSALGDVNIAEPNALIGFAGARVAAGTTGESLPEGFQRSEFLFSHGFLDLVVPRAELHATLAGLLQYLRPAPDRAEALASRRARAVRPAGGEVARA